MKIKTITFAALAACVVGSSAVLGADNRGLQIARKLDAKNSGFVGETAHADLILIDQQGQSVSRQLELRTLERRKRGDQSLVRFVAPADVKGTKLLTWSHPNEDDQQWIFLPAIKRVKRISGRNKAGSFMGSEFAYEDLSSPEVEKFSYRFVKEDALQGLETWVFERFPKDSESGYKRQVVWASKKLMFPVKIEYYNRRDELLKVAVYGGFKQYGTFWRPSIVQVTNVQTKKKSVLKFSQRRIGQQLDEQAFRSDALAR